MTDPDIAALLDAGVAALSGQRRDGQHAMALAVGEALDSGTHLLVQAGTGTGKSLAYLVPALLHARATGRPVVVATATLALQAQLMAADLPRLAAAVQPQLGKRPTFASLKGRANYACLHRVRDGVPDDTGALVPLADVVDAEARRSAAGTGDLGRTGADVLRARAWAQEQAQRGGPGDRDSLEPGVADRAWAQVSVTAAECMGAVKCPYAGECFAERAREKAEHVDIVVTNHALLAIAAIDGLPVLPEHDVAVVDEGHELVNRVTSVATAELSPTAVERAGRRARSSADEEAADDLEGAADVLRAALAAAPVGRLDALPDSLGAAVVGVRDAARRLASSFSTSGGDRPPDVEAARRQARAAVDEVFATAERIAAFAPHDVVWLDAPERGAPALRVAPLSVADLLRRTLFDATTVVMTSATLSLGGSFDAVVGAVGLADVPADRVRTLDVGSPFDYPRQAILYCARHLPAPSREPLGEALLAELAELVEAAGGRTLGLFSSRRAARSAALAVREALPGLRILCQGDDQLPTLVRQFVEEPATSLFGTLSLWQGVDAPGPTCTLVVVDRLPFPRPDDPLSSARVRATNAAGGNGFMAVAATHAALLLAQGTGRLVRRAADRGVVAVLDPRLATARYGAYLRASLPPMWATTDPTVVRAALRRLDAAAGGTAPMLFTPGAAPPPPAPG